MSSRSKKRRNQRSTRRFTRRSTRHLLFEPLETRVLLTGEPAAMPDTFGLTHDTVFTATAPGVLTNDIDPIPGPSALTAQLITNVSHGTLSLNANGSFTYTPAAQYVGADSFTYKAFDGANFSMMAATVTLNVNNAAPIANDDSFNGMPNTDLIVAAPGVKTNDSDPNGDALTASLVTGPTHGTLTFNYNGNGGFKYIPNPGYVGSDSFTYRDTDSAGATDTALVSITIKYAIEQAQNQSLIHEVSAGSYIEPLSDLVSLAYNSVASDPDVIAMADLKFGNLGGITDTLKGTFTILDGPSSTKWWSLQSLSATDPWVRVTDQVYPISLPSGRYKWEWKFQSENLQNGELTLTGYVNLINHKDSALGKGWDILGLYRLYLDRGPGVPDGVVLSTGDGEGRWYERMGGGNNYTTPAGDFSTLVAVGGGWQLTDKFGCKFNFNGTGRLTSRVERTGETTTCGWTGNNLTSITDHFGRPQVFAYTADKLTSITDIGGSITMIGQSGGTGSLLTSTVGMDPDGSGPLTSPTTTFSYGIGITSITTPNGGVTLCGYDAYRRRNQVTYPEGATQSWVGEHTWGHGGTSQSQPASIVSRSAVSPSTTDELGGFINYKTDRLGNPVWYTDPLGNPTTWVRTADGLPVTITSPDPDGAGGPLSAPITNLGYDTKGNLISCVWPDGASRTMTYNAYSEILVLQDERGAQTTRTYDANGNLLTETDPLLHTATWTHNSLGRPLTLTLADPDGPSGPLTSSVYAFAYDGYQRLTTLTNPGGSTQNFTWNAVDKLASEANELGQTASYDYDLLWRLVSVTDAAGGVVLNAYDPMGRVIKVTDALGHFTTYTRNLRGWVTQAVAPDPDGVGGPLSSPTSTFTYNNKGDLLTETDALGRVIIHNRDILGRETSVLLPDPDSGGPLAAPLYVYRYDNLSRMTGETDPLGGQTNWAYNSRGLVTSETGVDPDSAGPKTRPVTSYTYYATGDMLSETDPLGRPTNYTIDLAGRTTQIAVPSPGTGSQVTFTFEHDNMDRVTGETDPLGRTTVHAYNARSFLTSSTLPDPDTSGPLVSPVYQFGYDLAGRQTSQTDPLGAVSTRTFNSVGLVLTSTGADPDGVGPGQAPISTNTWDLARRLTENVDPGGRHTQYQYDNLDRRTAVLDHLNQTTSFSYDAVSNVLTVKDPLNNTDTHTYDNLDRRISTTDARGGVTQLAFDALSNLTTLKDPQNNTTAWVRDGLGRAIQETNALGASRHFDHDAVGNVTKITDRNGRVREFAYNGWDQVKQEVWKTGGTTVRTIDYTFNIADELTAAADADSQYAYTYDMLSRLLSVSNAGTPGMTTVVLTSAYDAASNRTSLAASIAGVADFKNAYSFDALGRMTRVHQTNQSGGSAVAPKGVDFSYNTLGQFTSIVRYTDLVQSPAPDVATSTFSYDSLARLTALTHKHAGTTIVDYGWTYDALSRVTQLSSTVDGTSNYTYDTTDELLTADHSSQSDEAYGYDLAGNRTNSGYSTGTNNRLLSDGVFNFTYDAEGSRITRTRISGAQADDYTTEYGWDHRNRLTSVTFKNNQGTVTKGVEYVYDVFDRRILKRLDSNGDGTFDRFERWVYDGGDVVLDFVDADGAGAQSLNLARRYLHGPAVDQVMAQEDVPAGGGAGAVLWQLGDNQGSTRDVVDSSGVVVTHLVYDSFGRLVSGSASTTRYLYTGREWDADVGLQYNRARWYDPASGRWISEDPIGFAAGDTNLSRYVGNSSTNATDPSGLAKYTFDDFARDEWVHWSGLTANQRLAIEIALTHRELSNFLVAFNAQIDAATCPESRISMGAALPATFTMTT